MKKSISSWSFPTAWDLRAQLSTARKASFSSFEVALDEKGPISLRSSRKELMAVRRLADKEKLVLSGLATSLYWGANAASENPVNRRRATEILQRQMYKHAPEDLIQNTSRAMDAIFKLH